MNMVKPTIVEWEKCTMKLLTFCANANQINFSSQQATVRLVRSELRQSRLQQFHQKIWEPSSRRGGSRHLWNEDKGSSCPKTNPCSLNDPSSISNAKKWEWDVWKVYKWWKEIWVIRNSNRAHYAATCSHAHYWGWVDRNSDSNEFLLPQRCTKKANRVVR